MPAADGADAAERTRLQAELEFVQLLADPNYLASLAQHGYFDDERFVNYLKYLQYWTQPEYAKYLRYPHCLFFLQLLQQPAFRKQIGHPEFMREVVMQQLLHWVYYARNRAQPAPAAGQPAAAQGTNANAGNAAAPVANGI